MQKRVRNEKSPLYYIVKDERRFFYESGKADKTFCIQKRSKIFAVIAGPFIFIDALDHILTPDAYGGYDGYTVRSVYFDSITNEDYIDKKRGADEKKRIRVRIYHTEDATAKFELKRKSFGRELKESLVISREDAQRLLKRDFTALLNYDSDVAAYAYDLMTSRLYALFPLLSMTDGHTPTRILIPELRWIII